MGWEGVQSQLSKKETEFLPDMSIGNGVEQGSEGRKEREELEIQRKKQQQQQIHLSLVSHQIKRDTLYQVTVKKETS